MLFMFAVQLPFVRLIVFASALHYLSVLGQ
jgi:hypothetical protein